MSSQCLIASYKGDFVWLQHCLRSLKKFSEEFLPPVISVSLADAPEARWIVQKCYPGAEVFIHSIPRGYDVTAKGFGMMRAMNSMMHADILCPRAEHIFLVGSDCLATAPFRPHDYFAEVFGQPVILMNSYEHLLTAHPSAVSWRDGTAQVLGWTPPHEYMRRLPSVFHRSTFAATRKYIETLHGTSFTDYWFGGYAAGQQGQSEANILGAYAARFQPERYKFDCMDDARGPDGKLFVHSNALLQMWSHGGLDKLIDIHYTLDGHDVFGMKPRDVIVSVLGDATDITLPA